MLIKSKEDALLLKKLWNDYKKERSFIDKGTYFVLIEESGHEVILNHTNTLIGFRCTRWIKTHLIITQGSSKAIQLLKFRKDSTDNIWVHDSSLLYNGISLIDDEWNIVCKRIMTFNKNDYR